MQSPRHSIPPHHGMAFRDHGMAFRNHGIAFHPTLQNPLQHLVSEALVVPNLL